MDNFSSDACNCLQKSNLNMIMQICTFSFVLIMFLDFYSYKNISCHYSWQLVTLSMEYVIMLIRHSRLDNHLQSLLLLFDFFTITTFAFGFLSDLLTTTSAFLTTSLSLCIHPRAKLYQFNSNSITFAIRTFFNFSSSFSITINTHSVPCNFYFFLSSCKYLFQSNIQLDQFRLHFLWFVTLPSLFKKIKNIAFHSWRSTILNSLFSILIIELSLFRI